MSKIEPRILKGFRDFAPAEQLVRQDMFARIQSVFERFGFLPLSTPVLEYKDILTGKYGEDEKLIYQFKDNGDREVAMRYDLTVPLARFVAQYQGQLQLPFKRYQIAPVWRADNPQKGRFREFFQCDIDTVGSDSIMADAETIACLCQALEALGLKNYRVRVNDRAVLAGLPQAAIRALDKLEKIGLEGVRSEMQSAGLGADIVSTVEELASGQVAVPVSVANLQRLLADYQLAGAVEFDPSIARGLDYYTGIVFEIVIESLPEYGSICSGGRYDNLVDQFSDKSLPAVGGSIGIDRLIGALYELNLVLPVTPIKVIVLNLSASLQNQYIALAAKLRQAGINTELFYGEAKLDKQFKYAEHKQIGYAVIMGETEAQTGKLLLKNLATREQVEVTEIELIAQLQN